MTRAAGQASAFAEVLKSLGAEPVLIPALEIVPPSSYKALDCAMARLVGSRDAAEGCCFQWLLFTSANAVECFAARLDQLALRDAWMVRTKGSEPCSPRLATIGALTAASLVAHGLAASSDDVLQPKSAVAEALLESLLPHVRRSDGLPSHFLLVRAERARELLPDALRAAGAEVTIAPAYQTVVPKSSIKAIQHLFANEEAVEAIAFTSSSSVENLLELCQAAGVDMPRSALRASIGPVTSATLAEAGLPPHVECAEASVRALAELIVQTLARQ